jgi:hypothetical protein
MQRQKYRWPLSCTRVLEQTTIALLRARISEFKSLFSLANSAILATRHHHIHSSNELTRVINWDHRLKALATWTNGFSLANQSSREWLAEEEEEAGAWDFQSFWMLVRPRRSFAFEISNMGPCMTWTLLPFDPKGSFQTKEEANFLDQY